MGTNSSAGHQSYTVAPALPTDTDANPAVDVAGAAAAEPELPPVAEVTDADLQQLTEAITDALAAALHSTEPVAPAETDPVGHDPAPGDEAGAETVDAAAATTNSAAVPGQDEATPQPEGADLPAESQPLTPLPEEIPEGQAVGVPVLVGGADLQGSTATLVAYSSEDGPREVLLATITEDAEGKLLEALAVPQLVPVQVEEMVEGRLPRDEETKLHELLASLAKNTNKHLKKALPIPAGVLTNAENAEAAIAAIENDPDATAAEQAMAAFYRAHLSAITDRHDGTVTVAYTDGGKVPLVTPYLHNGLALVTKLMPAPPDPDQADLMVAQKRSATRLQPTIDPATGDASWDGTARSPATGSEYVIDLGDGYTAVYRPYVENEHTEFSLRGKLDLIAPAGAGHAAELVERLGRLNLVNRPMTAAEGEWTYLKANLEAQGLAGNGAVSKALAHGTHVEDLRLQELFHQHARKAVGLDEAGLSSFARRLQLEAAASCLPKKVSLLRDAVATATGHGDGAALAASPGYDPTPKPSGGWLTWGRFDVTGAEPTVAAAWKGRRLVHQLGGGGLPAVLATGVLASTERRATMGVTTGLGMSEDTDKLTGGANSVFLRVRSAHSAVQGPALVWDDPSVLLRRSDYYGYNGDHFGAVNPAHHNHSANAMTRDPLKIATFNASNNEIMFGNGIDLLGAEAPDRIVCSSETHRQKILAQLGARGVTTLRGRPVADVVTLP